MAKFNTRGAVRTRVAGSARSPIRTEVRPSGVTHEGAAGYARDAKSELFLLAVANLVGEPDFYEKTSERDQRFEQLVAKVTVEDTEWVTGFLGWLRSEANMRSASLVGGLVAAKALLDAWEPGGRQIVASVLQRADEPGEALAWWMGRYGRAIPKPVKRGIADAARRLYTPYSLLKYDTPSKAVRFGDVLELTHPKPVSPEQAALFRFAIDRRHDRIDLPMVGQHLPMVLANIYLRSEVLEKGQPELLLDPERLRAAGMTWEDALSLAGPKVDKGKLWAALMPSLPMFAAVRNLRNIDEAGVPDDAAQELAKRISDAENVKRSRMFPFRFLAAHRAVSSVRWSQALEKALTHSLANVPELPGRTLILVDLSGSMDWQAGGANSDMCRADVAKVFGAALALRAENPTLVWFDSDSGQVAVPKGGALLKLVESFPRRGGGTATAAAVQRWYNGHDRVVIITDEQAHPGYGDPGAYVPANVPVYTWNLGGYRYGHGPSGDGNRHTFGGLTDGAFQAIPLLEGLASGNGEDVSWPWMKSGVSSAVEQTGGS